MLRMRGHRCWPAPRANGARPETPKGHDRTERQTGWVRTDSAARTWLGVEGDNTVGFLEKWLPEILGLTDSVEIERAHHTLQRCPAEQGAPRAFVLKLLCFRYVTRILEASRKRKELLYGNSKIMIFPNLSPTLHKKRMAFNPLKKQLRQAGLKYGMMYPATFRVDTRSGGASHLNQRRQPLRSCRKNTRR